MQVELIQPSALISLTLSTPFYTRLQELLVWMISQQDTDTVRKANESISKGVPLDEWGEHYKTLLILINDIEESAKEQGKTEQMDAPAEPA